MKYIELFAGIGGFRYGLESIDRNKDRESKKNKARVSKRGKGLESKERKETNATERRLNEQFDGRSDKRAFTCVYANEWDKYAAQIYKKHYGEIDTRDITTVKASEIPDHDLLTAGFPCQSFSIAGKRRGFNDTRGTLFFEIARILKEKRPRYLLLENVKGLLSHDKGKTFQTILGVLSDMGYECEWQVLNSKHFGVPQNRERVFIVGHLGGESGRKVFPIGESNGENFTRFQLCNRQQLLERNKRGTIQKEKTKATRVRRLTPIECERLQGFPDGWTEGISDTQRYKCLGNAVTTNVITAIGISFKAKLPT